MRVIHYPITAAVALLLHLATSAHAQLQFTAITPTVEGATQLTWQSETNTVYEVQYADQLNGNDDGTTAWLQLYTDYPSQGTSTTWLDTGNYNLNPPILHPRNSAARFYRIYNLGTNTGPNPTISIVFPSDGASVSSNLTVVVNASSDQDLVRTLLFVDGQEMPPSRDGTNFVINTCEWPNGSHTLFAVAKSQSQLEGTPNDTSITYGRTVSPQIHLTFNNLITGFSWSEPYFEPALGQTQHVSAIFAAKANWTLQILDVNSNAVLTTTGTGGSMHYPWDGTGQGGTNLPPGIYNFQLSAGTNGQSLDTGGVGPSLPSPPPTTQSRSDDWYPVNAKDAVAAQWDHYYVQASQMPPVWTNETWMNWVDIYGPDPVVRQICRVTQSLFSWVLTTTPPITSDTPDPQPENPTPGYSGPPAQTTIGPVRPPNAPGQGTIGTVGVGYQTYFTSSGYFTTPPIQRTGPPIPTYIELDGRTGQANEPETWGSILEAADICNGFTKTMANGRYKPTLVKVNNSFTSADLRTNAFSQCNVGLAVVHGSYATTAELDGIRHVYLRFRSSSGSTDFAKLADCNFGGAGTNGLKWMALLVCNVLHPDNYDDMYTATTLPINNDLHLLLGASTLVTAAPDVGKNWAFNMLGPEAPALTVEQAWYEAGKDAYKAEFDYPNLEMYFRVAGWPDAFGDKLKDVDKNPGTGNPYDITSTTVKVHPL